MGIIIIIAIEKGLDVFITCNLVFYFLKRLQQPSAILNNALWLLSVVYWLIHGHNIPWE